MKKTLTLIVVTVVVSVIGFASSSIIKETAEFYPPGSIPYNTTV